jgi:hypothetical protein
MCRVIEFARRRVHQAAIPLPAFTNRIGAWRDYLMKTVNSEHRRRSVEEDLVKSMTPEGREILDSLCDTLNMDGPGKDVDVPVYFLTLEEGRGYGEHDVKSEDFLKEIFRPDTGEYEKKFPSAIKDNYPENILSVFNNSKENNKENRKIWSDLCRKFKKSDVRNTSQTIPHKQLLGNLDEKLSKFMFALCKQSKKLTIQDGYDPKYYMLYQRYRKNEANVRYRLIARPREKGGVPHEVEKKIANFYGIPLKKIAEYHDRCAKRDAMLREFLREKRNGSLFIVAANPWKIFLSDLYGSIEQENVSGKNIKMTFDYKRFDGSRRLVYCCIPLLARGICDSELEEAARKIASERPDIIDRLALAD